MSLHVASNLFLCVILDLRKKERKIAIYSVTTRPNKSKSGLNRSRSLNEAFFSINSHLLVEIKKKTTLPNACHSLHRLFMLVRILYKNFI